MSHFIAILTAASFGVTPMANAWMAAKSNESAIWVTLCTSGRTIKLDLGQDNETPLPPTHNKACHAICCKRDDNGKGAQKDNNHT